MARGQAPSAAVRHGVVSAACMSAISATSPPHAGGAALALLRASATALPKGGHLELALFIDPTANLPTLHSQKIMSARCARRECDVIISIWRRIRMATRRGLARAQSSYLQPSTCYTTTISTISVLSATAAVCGARMRALGFAKTPQPARLPSSHHLLSTPSHHRYVETRGAVARQMAWRCEGARRSSNRTEQYRIVWRAWWRRAEGRAENRSGRINGGERRQRKSTPALSLCELRR